jgi:hypothetical protein
LLKPAYWRDKMFRRDGAIQLSASDLVGHLNCRYLTSLDLAVANGQLAKPQRWDPLAEILAERGVIHERDYIAHLSDAGHAVSVVDGNGIDANSAATTSRLMKDGADIIAQGALAAQGWIGRADSRQSSSC